MSISFSTSNHGYSNNNIPEASNVTIGQASRNVAQKIFDTMINKARFAISSYQSAVQNFIIKDISGLSDGALVELGKILKDCSNGQIGSSKIQTLVRKLFDNAIESSIDSNQLIAKYNQLRDIMNGVNVVSTRKGVFSAEFLELDKDIYEYTELDKQSAKSAFEMIVGKTLFTTSTHQFAVQRLVLNDIQTLQDDELRALGEILREHNTRQVLGIDPIAKIQSMIRQIFEHKIDTQPNMDSKQVNFIEKYNQLRSAINLDS